MAWFVDSLGKEYLSQSSKYCTGLSDAPKLRLPEICGTVLPMTALRPISVFARRTIVFVLLLAIVLSGVPLVEVHAHENATFGHSHASLDHGHGSVGDHDSPSYDENADEPGTLHVHSLDTPALTLLESLQANPANIMHACDAMVLRSRPPDNVIAPLYRPPIA